MAFSMWSWLLVVAVLAIVALILFAGRSSVKDPEAVAGGGMVRATRRIAWLYVAGCVVGGLTAMVSTVWGDSVTVKLPVQEFWPALPGTVTIDTPLATVESGGFTWANVSVSGLTIATRLMLAGAVVAQSALAVGAGLVIIKLCTSVMNRTLFVPALVKGVQIIAGVVFMGGTIWQACQIFGGSMAAEQVLGANAWELSGETIAWTDIHNIVGMPSVAYFWEFNFWPIGVALVLMVLAELFRQGSKVQKDAAGLI
ncbi:hypothetical protein [Specibacter sp. NPDC078709]|uniref:hypothetical protein n=1 Tax=Specibacter sp. NPDC078709 TaxID=3154364 RepID=UPI00343B513F